MSSTAPDDEERTRRALGPDETGAPDPRPPTRAAAGVEAVTSSLLYTLRLAGATRGTRALLRVNQSEGFDCPGCAWPDPGHRATAEFCENGARAVADEATLRRVDADFFARHSIAELAARSDQWLNAQGRLTQPMFRAPGATHYQPIGWDAAFGQIAETLRGLAHPNEAIFYTSGRTSNEAAFLYQLFARAYGTNNLPDCSNMCHESSGTGLGESLGIGKGSVRLSDFEKADAIFVLGQNPGTNHPRMLSALRDASRRGCTIVTVNPLREPGLVRFKHPQKVGDILGRGTPISSEYLQIKIGGDAALLKAMQKLALEAEAAAPGTVLDHDFIAQHCVGFDALAPALAALEWSTIESQTGLTRAEIERVSDIYLKSERVIVCWAMGLTQHKNAVGNIQEVVNLLLLRGQVGKEGAGVCPVRGHSNVQGDRTMGIWEYTPSWIDALDRSFGIASPRETGVDAVGAIEAMAAGQGRVFFGLGGNFLSATPDTKATAAALERCDLTVQVSTKLNRAHLVTGRAALILPCLGRSERDEQRAGAQFVTVENSMGIVHRSQGRLAPASSELRSEPWIVCELARATLGDDSAIEWSSMRDDYRRIRAKIAEVVPGFEDYERRVADPQGFELPNGAREREFHTASGKAEFHVSELPDLSLAPGQLRMMTIRSHDQYNTTVYTHDDRYRGIEGFRRVVFMNPRDMRELGFEHGQWVDLHSHFEGERRSAPRFRAWAHDIPQGCCATYFPEANVLVPLRSFADRSRTPTSKSVVVTLEASEGGEDPATA